LNCLNDHKAEYFEKYAVTKLGFFGSYARGENHPGSDVDIVVELSDPDMFALIAIKQELEEKLGTRVDIVRLREKMNPLLRQRIERDARYV
jgi:predicted nucleotidyltransferase